MAEKLAAPSMYRLHHVSTALFVDGGEVDFAGTNELIGLVFLVIPYVDLELSLKTRDERGGLTGWMVPNLRILSITGWCSRNHTAHIH